MANQFLKLRRSAVPGRIPSTSSLDFGEIALNTYDGLAFLKKSGSNGEEIVAIGANTTSITGSTNYIPLFSGTGSLVTSSIYQTGSFTSIRNATTPEDPNNPDILYVNGEGVDTHNIVSAHSNRNGYVQTNVQNYSNSTQASSDVVATANNGDEDINYIDMGINSSGYDINQGIVGGQNDAYLYSTGENLLIGNATPNRRVVIFNGGLDTEANAKIYIHDQGTVGINTSGYNGTNPPSLQIEAPSSYTYNAVQIAGEVDNYFQLAHTNRSGGTTASADIVAYNNIDPEGQLAGFIDMGIASTNYVRSDIYPGAEGDAYVFTDAPHLLLGATSGSGATKVTIFAGGINEAENAKLILFGNNQHLMSGSLDISGSLTVGGTITAQTLVVQTITSSVEFITGSTIFGSLLSNTHQFTGSVSITGSLNASIITGSLFGTASWAQNAVTASYVDAANVAGLSLFQITTGSVTASVGVGANDLFLIKSGSTTYFNISSSGDTTINTNKFVVQNLTTQQPVLTVSQSVVQFATQSSIPTGTTAAGSIVFTSSSMYIGLE